MAAEGRGSGSGSGSGSAPESVCSSSVTVTRPVEVCHEFIIKNYSSRRGGIGISESLNSDQFMAGGYMWMICFFPKGKTADVCYSGYTSLYISLESNVSDDVPCFIEILLLDQSGKDKHQGCFFPQEYPPDITYCSPGPHQGLYYFFKRDILYKPSNHYLKDDRMKIRCTIRVLNSHILKLPLNKVPDPINVTEFQQLVKTEGKKHADVFFEVAGETYGTHRAILAVHSPAFRSTYDGIDQDIVLPDTEPRILKALLWFVYTATLLEEEQDREQEQEAFYFSTEFIFESFMGKMLAAADQLRLERLKEIYESRILERVSYESVAYLLHLAERCHATKLKDTCLGFAAENLAAVLETNGARYLKEACPSLFLELAGYTEIPSTYKERELDTRTKVTSVMKGYFCGIISPHSYKKLKEV